MRAKFGYNERMGKKKTKNTMIYLVRHGETEWNFTHRMQGVTDIPLNDTGLTQAEKIGNKLKNVHFDILYVSPLTRARQTAQAIHKHHPNLTLEIRPDLVERSYGELEGLTYEALDALHPAMEWGKSWVHVDYRPPGGESLRDIHTRVDAFITHVLSQKSGNHIAVVAHGVTLRIFVGAFLGIPIEQLGELEMNNASLAILEHSPIHGRSIHIANYRP